MKPSQLKKFISVESYDGQLLKILLKSEKEHSYMYTNSNLDHYLEMGFPQKRHIVHL